MSGYSKQWAESFDKRQKNNLNSRTLLIFREKHGNRHFLVPTVDDLYGAALKLLDERNTEGWFDKPEQPEAFEYNEEQLKALPEGKVRDAAFKLYEEYLDEVKQYEEDKAVYDRVIRAIEEKDGRLAWYIIKDRKSYEYEDYYWDLLEKI